MIKRKTIFIVSVLLPLVAIAAGAKDYPTQGKSRSRYFWRHASDDDGKLQNLRRSGMFIFTTPFTKQDGLGDGPWSSYETPPWAFGNRPTLQGNTTFLRVNGLDAQSCNECHSIVKHSTRPPTLGIGGVGGHSDSPMLLPTLIDVADGWDVRSQYATGYDPDLGMAFDGTADYNGRLINPPFLFGGGGVELLAKEMTADLQELLAQARSAPEGTEIQLFTHGVHFGYLVSLGGGEVDFSTISGIGPENGNYGAMAQISFGGEIPLIPEEALVVRPFGRKGENFSMRDFDRAAMQFHLGIQPVELFGAGMDPDGDGVTDEITIEEMSLLHIFTVTNPVPCQEKLDHSAQQGRRLFETVGCSECHIPALHTRSRFLPLAHPEISHDPFANVYYYIDLKKVGFKGAPQGTGVVVPLYADLKRHDMGPRLAESFDQRFRGFANSQFTTARLWGVADTAPYLHDGRATSLFEAIEFHGGEAQAAQDTFINLPESDQKKIMDFLTTLRTPDHPNEELIPRKK